MRPQDAFNYLLKAIQALLKKHGFTRKANNFYIKLSGNWGLINFQKSDSCTQDRVKFTINLGICSQNVLAFIDPVHVSRKPTITACHWDTRIGFLLEEKNDKWWIITNETPIEPMIAEISDCLIEKAMLAIFQNITDEQLKKSWLLGKGWGKAITSQLIYLSSLLKQRGEKAELELVIKQIEEYLSAKPYATVLQEQLQRLRE